MLVSDLRVNQRVLNRPMSQEILDVLDVYIIRFQAVHRYGIPQAMDGETGVEPRLFRVPLEEFLHARDAEVPLLPREQRVSGVDAFPQVGTHCPF